MLVIKNGKLVLPKKTVSADIAVEDGKIREIGKRLSGEQTLDARGLYVLPGLIDAHVHFREPGASSKEDWFTGSCAAAAGGVTTVLDMPNTNPPTVTRQLLDEKRRAFAFRSVVDYGFHFGASTSNTEELRKITKTASVKFYLGSTTGSLLVESDSVLFDQLTVLAKRDILATAHAEDEWIIKEHTARLKAERRNEPGAHSEARPTAAAAESAERMMLFCRTAGCRLHLCHVSSRDELARVEKHKKTMALSCEVTPHHLFLSEKDYAKLGAYAKTNPPIRTPEDRMALWTALRSGMIDIVATDHAPHLRESKQGTIWDVAAGVPGLETMLPLLLNEVNKGRFTLEEIAKTASQNPAKIFGIKNKGRIAVGCDADFAVVDMGVSRKVDESKLFTKCGWSPFAGRRLKGWPVLTIVRGNVVYDRGEIRKNKGAEVSYV